MKKKKIFKNIIRIGLLALCGAVLGVNLYFANAGSLLGDKLPMPFGYGAAVVLSGSMEPALSKGDANNTADEPISLSAIKGKVIFVIPFVGRIVGFIKTPIGTLCVIAAAILLIEIPRRNEKKKDDSERQKIIDEIKRLKEQA